MISRRIIASTTLGVVAALGATAAFAAENNAPKNSEKSLEQKIGYLQHQIDQLKAEQNAQKTDNNKKGAEKGQNYALSSKCPDGKCVYHPSQITIGTYFDKDDDNGPGANLLINDPTVRQDASLLKSADKLKKEAAELGAPLPPVPRVTIGGQLEASLAKDSTDIKDKDAWLSQLSAATLVAYVQATPWIGGYFDIGYHPDDNDRFQLDRGFVVVGNLSKSPFFLSAGKMYAPFGHYATGTGYMSPVTKKARTLATVVNLGFQQVGDNAFHANLYTYEGTVPVADKSKTHQWGAEAGYQFKHGDFGGDINGGYISNIEDSQGFSGNKWYDKDGKPLPDTHKWAKAVGGIDVNGSLSYKAFTLLAEYVQAVSSFDANDLSFGGTASGDPAGADFKVTPKSAQPKMMHTELQYSFNTFGKPSTAGVGYGHTIQAVALGLPQNRYSVFYSISPIKHTLLTVEYDRDQHYDAKYAPDVQALGPHKGPNAVDTSYLGKSENVYAVVFDVYF